MTGGLPPYPRDGIYDLGGGGVRQGPFGGLGRDFVRTPRGKYPWYPKPRGPLDEDRRIFTPNHRRHYEERDEDDLLSNRSNQSYVRRPPSPHIIYPDPAPYHGGPLRPGHRYDDDIEDDDDDDDDDEDEDEDDERFFRIGAHTGRRSGLGRDRDYLRGGRRGYDDDGDDIYDV